MAIIDNVGLVIDGVTNDIAKATVRYRLRATPAEITHPHLYREAVQLFGIDEGPGEDGVNEPIPGGLVFSGTMAFASTAPINRTRVLELPVSALNEDPGLGSPVPFPKRDEIRARVTLTQLAARPVSQDSNTVNRGGFQLP